MEVSKPLSMIDGDSRIWRRVEHPVRRHQIDGGKWYNAYWQLQLYDPKPDWNSPFASPKIVAEVYCPVDQCSAVLWIMNRVIIEDDDGIIV